MHFNNIIVTGLRKYFWPALSGIMLTSAFSGGFMSYVAWIALVPVLFSISEDSHRQAALKGFVMGLFHSMTLFSWIVYTMHVYGFLPYIFCIPVLVLLASYIALYSSLSVFAASFFKGRPFLTALAFALVWVCTDYARGIIFTGFPWGFLGYSQHEKLSLIQVADLAGVYAVTFGIVLFNGFIYWAISLAAKAKTIGCRAFGVSGSCVLLFFAIFFAGYFYYGQSRLQEISAKESNAGRSKIAMIQGNIDQSVKWDPAFQIFTIEKYVAMTKRAAEEKPDFVVWPETAAPFYFLFDKSLTKAFLDSVKDIGVDLVFGSPYVIFKNKEPEYFNSVYSMDKEGKIKGRYDKTHLVPFGEYTPLKDWIPFIGKIVPLEGDFSTGDPGRILETASLKIGTQICYEVIFPRLSRLMVKNGADLIVNVTNDAWFGKTGAPSQHFAISAFRAIENRRTLIRCANTGYTGFVLPSGQVRSVTGLYEDAIRVGDVPVLKEASFYTEHGDLFIAVCFAALIMCFASGLLVRLSKK